MEYKELEMDDGTRSPEVVCLRDLATLARHSSREPEIAQGSCIIIFFSRRISPIFKPF